ncbi:hypothetical protein WDW37_03700 [Bdellovibrionota bacterium FG-1]
MQIKMSGLSWIVGVLFGVLFPLVTFADSRPFQVADNGEYIQIRGTASFEARQTVIPLVYCDDDAKDNAFVCPHTQTYWALNIESGGVHYEVDQVFAKGSMAAPQFVELQSVMVRSGARLLVEGRVNALSRGYGILSDLRKVELVMDQPMGLTRKSFGGAESLSFYGWTCHSLGAAHPLYVDVIQVSRKGGYEMRIQGWDSQFPGTVSMLAIFEGVQLANRTGILQFQGLASGSIAVLAIDERGGRINDLDSTLYFNDQVSRLVCSLTR